MPNTRCSCPSCRHVFRVPDDIVGKAVRCPGCKARLTAKAAPGGKTILAMAGVDGDAPTAEQDLPATTSPGEHSGQARPAPAAKRPRKAGSWLLSFGLAGVGCGLIFVAVVIGFFVCLFLFVWLHTGSG